MISSGPWDSWGEMEEKLVWWLSKSATTTISRFGPRSEGERGSTSDLVVFSVSSFPLYLSNAQIKQHYCRKQNNNIKSQQLRSFGGCNGPSFAQLHQIRVIYLSTLRWECVSALTEAQLRECSIFCGSSLAGADLVTVEGWGIWCIRYRPHPQPDEHIWSPDNNRCGWRELSALWKEHVELEWAVLLRYWAFMLLIWKGHLET